MARHAREAEGSGSLLGWFVRTLAICVALVLLLRFFVIGVYYVPSGSMLDTIQIGDLVLGEKVTTFESPLTPGETLVKRVVAVGGQTVELVDGRVVVDGRVLEEPYVGDAPTESLSDLAGSAGITYPYTVPEGSGWVMGDNRTNSKDSRYFGPVSVDDVTSRAILIYWPLSDAGPL